MRVFVTGATGLIGRRLLPALRARGDAVVALTRKPPKQPLDADTVVGDPTTPGPWLDQLLACDAVVHLAGAGVFDRRWTTAFKQEIRDSRVNSTRTISDALARGGHAVRTLVSGSGIGIYGDRGEEVLTERSDIPPGDDFMANLAVEWEAAADPARPVVRVCHTRTSIVLDRAGGALPSLARPYRLFAGGPVGGGRQYVSWIHHADMTRLLLFALDTDALAGPFNACSPNPVPNDPFGRTLGNALGRPHWLPVPGFALKVALGEVATVALRGQRAIPAAATAAGFAFWFPELDAALRDLYSS